MELDAVVFMEFRGTFPLNSIQMDVPLPHGMPWNFFSTEIDEIPWRYFLQHVPNYQGAMSRYFLPFLKS